MKLGFVLKITNGGESEARSINKQESWARYATDARSAIKELTNYDGTEKIAYLVKFLGSLGYLFSVIKARPEGSGRPNDNTAAWIYIPANVDISSDETINVLKTVEEAISEKKGTDYEKLERLFNQEYETNDILISAVGTINSNESSTYAVRYYNGDYTLRELIGRYIAQQEYGKYKGILLVDKTQSISHTAIMELDFEPKQICIYNPLHPIDGFTPCFLSQNQYRPFNKAIEVPAGTPVTIYWVKNGYSVVKKSFLAQDGPTCPETARINQNDYKVIIPKKLFYVTDNNGIPVKQFDVWINYQLMDGDSMEVSESLYNQGLVISIKAKGFAEWRRADVHPQLNRALDIRLSKQVFQYDFTIPVYIDGKDTHNDAVVHVETYYRLKSSPIKGYVAYDGIQEGEGRINRLELDDSLTSKLKYMLYGVALCLFALLLYAGCSALDNYEFNLGWPPFKEVKSHKNRSNDNANLQQGSEGENNSDNTDIELMAAIGYLDNNTVWIKDSLESNQYTQGLFDEMNNFNSQQIIARFNERLSKSIKLQEVKNALEDNSLKGFNPRLGKEDNNGKYNPEGDNKISIPKYIEWLSDQHSTNNNQVHTNSTPLNTNHQSRITGGTSRSGEQSPHNASVNENKKPRRGGI